VPDGIETALSDRFDPAMEIPMLKRQAADLQVQLEAVRQRLETVEAAAPSS
jgi:hypothetical protein